MKFSFYIRLVLFSCVIHAFISDLVNIILGVLPFATSCHCYGTVLCAQFGRERVFCRMWKNFISSIKILPDIGTVENKVY